MLVAPNGCTLSSWGARIPPVHAPDNFISVCWEAESDVLFQKFICSVGAIRLYLLCSSSVLTLWFSITHYKSSVWKFQSHHWSLLQQHNTDKQLMEREVLLLCCSLLLAHLGLQLLYFSDSIRYWILEQSFSGYKVRHYFVICMSNTERTILLYCKLPTTATN